MPEHQQIQQSEKSDTVFQKQLTPVNQTSVSNPYSTIQRAKINPKSLTHADIMQLQRTIGNRAVGRLLLEIGLITSKDNQAPPVKMQKISKEEKEPLQSKMTKTVQRQITTDKKTIQMMKFNKKGKESSFGSYDTENYEKFISWMQTLDLDTLHSIASQLAKKGKKRDKNEEAAFQAVRAKYADKKQSHLAEQRDPSLSEEEKKKVQDLDEEGIREAEFDREQAETDRILAETYRLIAGKQPEIAAYASGVDQQLQQTYKDVDEQKRKMQSISDAVDSGIASTPSMIGTVDTHHGKGDEALEREIEQLPEQSDEDEALEREIEQLPEQSDEELEILYDIAQLSGPLNEDDKKFISEQYGPEILHMFELAQQLQNLRPVPQHDPAKEIEQYGPETLHMSELAQQLQNLRPVPQNDPAEEESPERQWSKSVKKDKQKVTVLV